MSQLQQAHPTSSLGLPHFPPLVKTLAAFFASKGTEAYLVGGVVRDALLGRATSDVDVAVRGDAPRLAQDIADLLGGRPVVLDDSRAIMRVVVPDVEGAAFVDISPAPEGIRADLDRRDFGLDAMAVSLSDLYAGENAAVIDYHGGVSDASDGVVRALSPSVFADDPARLLRGPRLAAQLGFGLADETADAIRRDAHLIGGVAQERTRDELFKLIAAPGATGSLRLLDELGLLCRIMPELEDARGVAQPKEHYWDVLDHCIETVGQVERLVQCRVESEDIRETPWNESLEAYFAYEVSDGHTRLTILKLAALLHDIGKPATKTVEASGRTRFLGHHTLGAEISLNILRRLRTSGDGVELVSRMVEYHLRPSQMAQEGELPSPKAIYRYYRDLGDAAIDTLFLNLADYLAARGPMLDREDWLQHCRVVGHIFDAEPAHQSPAGVRRLIDGHDIMKEFSLQPGPQIGDLLEVVGEAQASGDIASKQEALELVGSRLESGGGVA